MNHYDYEAQKHDQDASNAPLGSIQQQNSTYAAKTARINSDLANHEYDGLYVPYVAPATSGTNTYFVGATYGGQGSGGLPWGKLLVLTIFGAAAFFIHQEMMGKYKSFESDLSEQYEFAPISAAPKGTKASVIESYRQSSLADLKESPLYQADAPFEKMFKGCKETWRCTGVTFEILRKLQPYALRPETYWSDICQRSFSKYHGRNLPIQHRWLASADTKTTLIKCTSTNLKEVSAAAMAAQGRANGFALLLASFISGFGVYVVYCMTKLEKSK